MIPLRDSTRSQTFPFVNVSLIILNLFIFFKESLLNPFQLKQLYLHYGVVPEHLVKLYHHGAAPLSLLLPLITATFLHGGWFHVLGNMLYLWVFGDNVEDRMGHLRYLLFYLLVGIAGNLTHILANPASTLPTIGASGAVAGVLGAYLVSFPRAKILTLVPIFFFITFVEIPAVVFLFLWFGMQLLNGFAALSVAGDTVAWWAHIGGFISGMALAGMFKRQKWREG